MERIAIADFRAKNIKDNPMAKLYLIKEGNKYFHITNDGDKGMYYIGLKSAKEEIQKYWGNWHDFKLLI